MPKILPALLLALACVSTSTAADQKEQEAKLRKEIAELRTQLATKEAELEKLAPSKAVEFLALNDLQPNQVGFFGGKTPATVRNGKLIAPGGQLEAYNLRVVKVVDKNRVIVGVLMANGKLANQQVLISGFDTSGTADGKVFVSPTVRVIGTEQLDGRTYAHVELVRK